MTPERIEEHGRLLRTKLERIRTTVGYENFRPLQDVFAIADDLCELVIALAQNQKLVGEALAPPPSQTLE